MGSWSEAFRGTDTLFPHTCERETLDGSDVCHHPNHWGSSMENGVCGRCGLNIHRQDQGTWFLDDDEKEDFDPFDDPHQHKP